MLKGEGVTNREETQTLTAMLIKQRGPHAMKSLHGFPKVKAASTAGTYLMKL